MIKRFLLLAGVLLLLVHGAHAKDITLSVNRSDYYFFTGEQAYVPLKITNTYGMQINGVLIYGITQEINQEGFHFSSTSTKATTFHVDNGESVTSLGFGTSDVPLTLKVGLTFTYNDKEQREVTLEGITIHFVPLESGNNDSQNIMENSSQGDSRQQPQQQVLEMINPVNQSSQNSQQQVQNNQIDQDISGLKQQIQEQLQEQQELKEEFWEQLINNSEFQEQHQDLLQQGYDLNNASLEPTANNSGTFEMNYTKENGEEASLKGEMQDGEIKSIYKQTSGEEVLEKKDDNSILYLLLLLTLVLLGGIVLSKKYAGRSAGIKMAGPAVIEGPVHYAVTAGKMLEEAKQLFEQGYHKDAYGKAGQALRLFLSYENNLAGEVTNDELIRYLKIKQKSFEDIKACLDMCSLVEFARYEANREDFDRITTIVTDVIANHSSPFWRAHRLTGEIE